VRTISFWVRHADGSMERLPGIYNDDELWLMKQIARKAAAAPAGSEARREHVNEVLTLHELKVTFEEHFQGIDSEIAYRPTQDSLFQIPEKALAELGTKAQQPLL
jgi:hypothetical protein